MIKVTDELKKKQVFLQRMYKNTFKQKHAVNCLIQRRPRDAIKIADRFVRTSRRINIRFRLPLARSAIFSRTLIYNLFSSESKRFFPFFITIILWYLANPNWNPFGIFMLIPIFYYMIKKIDYWFGFSLYMFFMLDFNTGTKFLFTGTFLLMKAINDFFGFFGKENGFDLKAFIMFLSAFIFPFGIFIIINTHHIFSAIISVLWLFVWVIVWYLPIVWMFKWIENDR